MHKLPMQVRTLLHSWTAVAALCFAGCAAVAGIEDARIDPKLTASTGGKPSSQTGAGGASSQTIAGDASTEDPQCREYCDLMGNYCGDPASGYQQFETDGVCMAFCSRLPRGDQSDTLVNSMWCRLKQARLAKTAASDAAGNCQAAGPGSDDITCGSKCATYCRMMREVCPADFHVNYSDDGACLEECRSLPASGAYDAKPAHDGKLKNVNCRLYHIAAAT
ncbi:MAG TPA: hypothetical protein VIV60_24795, partial [Polyangiaceae bacterium]